MLWPSRARCVQLGGAASGEGPGSLTLGSPMHAEAYLERLRAEADALDKTNRLRVAQEQLLEYAKQKESDAEEVLRQAEAAEAAAQASPELLASVTALREKLAEAAAEARAFAAQQKADVETLKRSSQQVCSLSCPCMGGRGDRQEGAQALSMLHRGREPLTWGPPTRQALSSSTACPP